MTMLWLCVVQSKSKTLIWLSMGAGVEEQASELLLQPKSDFLVLNNIHFTSTEWRDTLLWRMNKAQKMGELFVMQLTEVTPTCMILPSIKWLNFELCM